MLAEIPPEVMEQTEPDRAEPQAVEEVEEEKPEPEPAPEEAFEAPAPEPVPEVIAAPLLAPPEPEEPPIPPEDMKLHQDAERFARLLVQEIVLYHPREVEQGRNQRNLYKILKEDIERSRDAYEHRFAKPSIKQRDYFNKALVKYLAEGNSSLLGN
jgi:hypothetical protein